MREGLAAAGGRSDGRDPGQYVSTWRERRSVVVAAVGASVLYLGTVLAAGPTPRGRLLDAALMGVAAAAACGATVFFYSRLDPQVKPLWAGYAVGVGLYSVVFALQGLREVGCTWCGGAAATVALGAFAAFGVLLAGGLRLAYGQADRRLWAIEVLDSAAVTAAAGFWVALLAELEVLAFRRPFLSVETVEVLVIPLLAGGLVFALRAVSTDIAHYKLLQAAFLLAVGLWIVARGLVDHLGGGPAWSLFALSRACVVAVAICLPAFGVAEGGRLRILDVEGPHERRVVDISIVVAALAVLVVLARLYVDPQSIAYQMALPALGVVTLLLVVRLAVTSEYHRHLEAVVTDSARRYRDIVEGAHHGVLEVDARGAVTYCNEAAGQILGHGRDRLLGRRLDELLQPVPVGSDFLAEEPDGSGRRSDGGISETGPVDDRPDLGLSARLTSGERVVARCDKNGSEKGSCYVELAPLSRGGQGSIKTILRDVTLEVERRMRVESLIRALEDKVAERAVLMREILETGESERASIASQLHDGPVQHLTLLALKTDLLRRRAAQGDPASIESACASVLGEVRAEAEELARLGSVLNPRAGADMDLAGSLEDVLHGIFRSAPGGHVERSARGEGLQGRPCVSVKGDEKLSCSPTTKIALYRSLQAMALDARLSGASVAEIELSAGDGSVSARFRTDVVLGGPGAKGVARAKTWALKFGGSFSERRSGSFYEAELSLPAAPEQIPREPD